MQKTWLLLLTVHVHFQEYIQDGIDWAKVDFDDNQDCLNLFEKVRSSFLMLQLHGMLSLYVLGVGNNEVFCTNVVTGRPRRGCPALMLV